MKGKIIYLCAHYKIGVLYIYIYKIFFRGILIKL